MKRYILVSFKENMFYHVLSILWYTTNFGLPCISDHLKCCWLQPSTNHLGAVLLIPVLVFGRWGCQGEEEENGGKVGATASTPPATPLPVAAARADGTVQCQQLG